jgi:chemotaxis protein methyltransferase CheR
VRSLERALAPGGVLVLGVADRLCRLPDPARRAARPEQPRSERPARAAGTWRARFGAKPSWRAASAAPEEAAPAPATAPAEGATPLADALAAADAGRIDEALAMTERALEADPLDADAHYIRGVAQLGSGEGSGAAASLRRALYVDPAFALAAFQLGRAYDLLGDAPAARRAYQQSLRTLSPDHERQRRLVAGVDLADVAAACGARLAALAQAS